MTQTSTRKIKCFTNIDVVKKMGWCAFRINRILLYYVIGEFSSSERCQVEVNKFIPQHTAICRHDTGLWASKVRLPENFKCAVMSSCQQWAFIALK